MDLLARLRAQAFRYDVHVRPGTVDKLIRDEAFTAVIGQERIRATTVLLATGVVDRQPEMASLRDFRFATLLGGIRWCPVCDGYEGT